MPINVRNFVVCAVIVVCLAGWGPFFFFPSTSSSEPAGSSNSSWIEKESKTILAQADNIDPSVLKLALKAYAKARQKGMNQKQVLTVVDYSKPSSERRLWVVDMKKHKVLFNTWVAHGKNSGGAKANSFSNSPTSLKSSLGVFSTADTYSGHHGYSLRIQGLEKGINDNAYRRAIVFHGAAYVTPQMAKERGTIGRSWGCLAVDQRTVKKLIDTIKDDTTVVAYYPDRHWLHSSSFVS